MGGVPALAGRQAGSAQTAGAALEGSASRTTEARDAGMSWRGQVVSRKELAFIRAGQGHPRADPLPCGWDRGPSEEGWTQKGRQGDRRQDGMRAFPSREQGGVCQGGDDPVRWAMGHALEDMRGTGSGDSGGSTRGKVGRWVPGQGEEREGASGSFHFLCQRKLRE